MFYSAILGGGFLAAMVGTGLVRRWSIRVGMLDVPNNRSSHYSATPTGGGVAIVLVVVSVAGILTCLGRMPAIESLAWCAGGGIVAILGLADDRYHLSPGSRLLGQFLAATLLVWVAHDLRLLSSDVPFSGVTIGGWILLALGIVWCINLFNFMDGTDGLAGAQAVFVGGSGAFLATGASASEYSSAMAAGVAAASAGFLVWNLPPARIFMGDVGSGFLGFSLAACALMTSSGGTISLWTWCVLHGAFLTDATVTVLVRSLRKERILEAHRSHAYQHLARRWKSHRKVLICLVAIDVFWLLPLAIGTVRYPEHGLLLSLCALVPLSVMVFGLGAGRGESGLA